MSVVRKTPGVNIVHVARHCGRNVELAVDDGTELGGAAVARLTVGARGARVSLWSGGRWKELHGLTAVELLTLRQVIDVAFRSLGGPELDDVPR